jgi:hypothetical protein
VPDDAEISVVEPIEPIEPVEPVEPVEPIEPIEPDDSTPGAHIDATSRATEHLGTRLELPTGGEPSANGFQHQEAGEPRA